MSYSFFWQRKSFLLIISSLIIVNKDLFIFSPGDADFRKSLRYISRVTEEVTEKSRKTQEVASARRARLDQYSQLLVCERDAQEVGICYHGICYHGNINCNGNSLYIISGAHNDVDQKAFWSTSLWAPDNILIHFSGYQESSHHFIHI